MFIVRWDQFAELAEDCTETVAIVDIDEKERWRMYDSSSKHNTSLKSCIRQQTIRSIRQDPAA